VTTRVAIIGGGAVGLASAWQLVERGVTDVTVLEAGEDVAAGSSSRSAGFIETQYVDPLDIELRARSMHEFRRLQRDHRLEVSEIGYLRLAPDDATLTAFHASVGIQQEFGIEGSAVLDPDRVRRLVPCWMATASRAGCGVLATAASTVRSTAASSPTSRRRAAPPFERASG
jgi:glycine/D-amino acid oxidase-like deaminating enzyme